MDTAGLTSGVPLNRDTTLIAKWRAGIACVPPLLAVLSVCVGVGLGALASGAEFRSGAPFVGTGRATEVEVLPRIVVRPRGDDASALAPSASESCTRLHC